MRVAIVHYHLSPGGVSTVIRAASRALRNAEIDHVILAGDSVNSSLPVKFIEGLNYLKIPDGLTATTLLNRLRNAAFEALGSGPDVWHFHNHSLGKNCLIDEVVDRLAAYGEALVLQIHDLAEDGRSQNYPTIAHPQNLYPVSPRIRYAFINSTDQNQFVRAGLPAEHSRLLLNPAETSTAIKPLTESPALVLYPSRAIRRKNIGELLLFSILAPAGTQFAITRAPENPDALALYDTWKRFADHHGLNVTFNAVDPEHPFESWLERSTHFITTSIAEGFGLTYLESITHQRPLIARNLKNVTTDHPEPIGSLYDHLLIPTDWVDLPQLRDQLKHDLTEAYRNYGEPFSTNIVTEMFESLFHEDHLDFGNLPERFQKQILTRLMETIERRNVFIQQNEKRCDAAEWLARALTESSIPAHIPLQNSQERFQHSLVELYEEVSQQTPSILHHLDPGFILSNYLQPRNLNFLKSTPPRAIRAVIFDVYGTLLIAPAGGVKTDPEFDDRLNAILKTFGYPPMDQPTQILHQSVLQHHRKSIDKFPEIDLRDLWQEILDTKNDLTELILAIEESWHPALLMPGAAEILNHLSDHHFALGLLSNAQINTLPTLTSLLGTNPFHSELCLFSYQQRIAKPSPQLYRSFTDRLQQIGVQPSQTLYVGNDPLQDIVPAKAAGFKTALFIGHPESLRPGDCDPDFLIESLSELIDATSSF